MNRVKKQYFLLTFDAAAMASPIPVLPEVGSTRIVTPKRREKVEEINRCMNRWLQKDRLYIWAGK